LGGGGGKRQRTEHASSDLDMEGARMSDQDGRSSPLPAASTPAVLAARPDEPPATAESWDDENGVWVGDRAAGGDAPIPSPLWIFGYG